MNKIFYCKNCKYSYLVKRYLLPSRKVEYYYDCDLAECPAFCNSYKRKWYKFLIKK